MNKDNNAEHFWQFSIMLWKQEDIKNILMHAQDHKDLDINLCLFALWSSKQKKRLGSQAEQILKIQQDYYFDLIKPTRQLRQRANHYGNSSLKQHYLDAELAAEKAYQGQLCQLRLETAPESEELTATLKENLRLGSRVNWSEPSLKKMLETIL